MTISLGVERTIAQEISPLFDLIADIGAYPLYMPGWRAVRILERGPGRMVVEQIIGLAGLSARFISSAALEPPTRLEITSTAKPFRQFRLLWRLHALAPSETRVRADWEFELTSRSLEELARRRIAAMVEETIAAFERRADQMLARR